MKPDKVGGAPAWQHHNPCCLAKIRAVFHTVSGDLCSEILYAERDPHRQERLRGIERESERERERERESKI
ncbi:hypothetical protein Hanom_Chr03g00191171 [Helianthus anomalus]